MMQRRRWERCRKELAVVIDAGGSHTVAAKTLDICEGGVGIVCDRAFEAGSRLRFEITEIASGPMTGIVRWCTPPKSDGAHIVGVELDSLSAAHRDALADNLAIWRSQAADEDA